MAQKIYVFLSNVHNLLLLDGLEYSEGISINLTVCCLCAYANGNFYYARLLGLIQLNGLTL